MAMPRTCVKSVNTSCGRTTDEKSEDSEETIVTEDGKEEDLALQLSLSLTIIKNASKCSEDIVDDDCAYTTFPYLQSSLFGSILEDTITELRILVECNNELRIIKAHSDWNYLQSLKYDVKQPKSVDELQGVDPHNLECDEYKINKLVKDRNHAIEVVTATYVDISLYKTFKALIDFVHASLAVDEYRVTLVEEEAKNKLLRRETNKQMRQQRNHIKSLIYDIDVRIDDLNTQVEDVALYSECRSRYIDNWQRARTEQNDQEISDIEMVNLKSIEYFKQRSDHEQRVHSEVELLINITITETLQKVEDWMNKYDKDLEAVELKIQIMKNDYINMLEKRLELEQTVEKHDVLMTEWKNFKEEREKARLYCEKMTNSAIMVQAWWRGILVRRELGPYKISKKKGAVPKKK